NPCYLWLSLSMARRFSFLSARGFAHHDSNVVRLLVVDERDRFCLLLHSVHFDSHHAATHTQRILYFDPIHRTSTPVRDLKLAPPTRYTRIDLQPILLQFETENVLQPGAIHPT